MASSQRLNRINSIILRDLSLLIDELDDKRIRNIPLSITHVSVTPDVKEADVYVSISGSDEDKKLAIDTLKHAAGYLRSELSTGLSTYTTPNLRFKLDDSVDYGNKIEEILNNLRETGQISDSLPEEEEEAF